MVPANKKLLLIDKDGACTYSLFLFGKKILKTSKELMKCVKQTGRDKQKLYTLHCYQMRLKYSLMSLSQGYFIHSFQNICQTL